MIDKDKSGSLSQRVNVIDGSVDYYGNFHYWQRQIRKPEQKGKTKVLGHYCTSNICADLCHISLLSALVQSNVILIYDNSTFKGDKEGLQADQGSFWGGWGKHVIVLDLPDIDNFILWIHFKIPSFNLLFIICRDKIKDFNKT